MFLLLKNKLYQPNANWLSFLFRVLVAAMLMATFIVWYASPFDAWIHWHAAERVLHLLVVMVTSMALYFGSLWFMGLRIHHFRVEDDTDSQSL